MPYDPNFDLNEYDSGMVSDYEATITNGHFGYDPEIKDNDGNPVTLFMFDGVCEDTDVGVVTEKWKVGKGWVPTDGGRSVEREDGRATNFNNNVMIAKAMQKLAESGFSLNDRAKTTGSMPWDAEYWNGLTCYFAVEEVNYGILPGQVKETVINKRFPTKVVAIDGVIVGGKTLAKKATPTLAPASPARPVKKAAVKKAAVKKAVAAPAAPAAAVAPAPEEAEAGEDPWIKALTTVALASETYEDFRAAAYELEGATEDDVVIGLIEDDSDDGVYLTAWAQA